MVFDSKREGRFWLFLQSEKAAGKICRFERQVPFEVIPACGDERPARYIADFVTYDEAGNIIDVYDVKSAVTRTLPEYVLKRKLMLWRHGLKIREV
jgi:hypothetical protein